MGEGLKPMHELEIVVGPVLHGDPTAKPCIIFVDDYILNGLHSREIEAWRMVLACCEDHIRCQEDE